MTKVILFLWIHSTDIILNANIRANPWVHELLILMQLSRITTKFWFLSTFCLSRTSKLHPYIVYKVKYVGFGILWQWVFLSLCLFVAQWNKQVLSRSTIEMDGAQSHTQCKLHKHCFEHYYTWIFEILDHTSYLYHDFIWTMPKKNWPSIPIVCISQTTMAITLQ